MGTTLLLYRRKALSVCRHLTQGQLLLMLHVSQCLLLGRVADKFLPHNETDSIMMMICLLFLFVKRPNLCILRFSLIVAFFTLVIDCFFYSRVHTVTKKLITEGVGISAKAGPGECYFYIQQSFRYSSKYGRTRIDFDIYSLSML